MRQYLSLQNERFAIMISGVGRNGWWSKDTGRYAPSSPCRYLRDRFLSLRLLEDYDAIVDACCTDWNVVAEDAERIRSLCLYPWIKKVIG